MTKAVKVRCQMSIQETVPAVRETANRFGGFLYSGAASPIPSLSSSLSAWF